MDWKSIFVPDVPLLEIIIRGSLMYVSLFILLRVVLKRQTGGLGTSDLLLVVLIADASQNGMASDYKSVTGGLILVVTIIFWNYAFDWLSYHFSWLEKLIQPAPLLLVKHGKMQHKNMRRELITEGELISQLREQGLEDVGQVKEAFMESDGRISVVQYEQKQRKKEERKGKA